MSNCDPCGGPNPLPRLRTGDDTYLHPTLTDDGYYVFDLEGLVEDLESELTLTGDDGVTITPDEDDHHSAEIGLNLIADEPVTITPDGDGALIIGINTDPPEAETVWTSPNEPGPVDGIAVTTGGTNGHDVELAVALDPDSPTLVMVDDRLGFDPDELVLPADSVGNAQIVNGVVGALKIADLSVIRQKLALGAVGPSQLDQALIWLPLVGEWVPYDPAWLNVSTGSGAPAGPASSVARAKQIGRTCHVHLELNFKTGGGFASGTAVPTFNLPHLPRPDSICSGSAMFIPFGAVKPQAAGVWINGNSGRVLWPSTASGFWEEGSPMDATPGGRVTIDFTYEVNTSPGTGGLS